MPGHQPDLAVARAHDEVRAAVAVEVPGDEAVVALPAAREPPALPEGAVAAAGVDVEALLGEREQVAHAVAGDVARSDELAVVAEALAALLPLEPALGGPEQAHRATLEPGDQVVASVAVDVADRCHEGVAAQPELLGGLAELPGAPAGADPHDTGPVGGHEVRHPVTGEVGGDQHVRALVPTGLAHDGALLEGGEAAGGDHQAATVRRTPHHQVGEGRRVEVVLRVGVADLDRGRRRRRGGRGLRGVGPDLRDLGVEVLARARRRAGVAVTVDRSEGAATDLLRHRRRVHAVQRELPREQLAVGAQHDVRRPDDVEVADGRHREGVVVVVERVGTDDRLVDAAVAALPDPTEPVDQEVVADVAPPTGLHVVGVDAADDRRHLGLGVVVGVDRVVDEAAADRAVAQRLLVADALVGAPLGAGVDGGLGSLARPGLSGLQLDAVGTVRGLQRAQLLVVLLVGVGDRTGLLGRLLGRRLGLAVAGGTRVDQRERQVVGQRDPVGARLDLHVVHVADDDRLGAGPRGPRLGAAGVGSVLVVVLEVLPGAPRPVGAGADLQRDLVLLEVLTVLPRHADGREALERLRLALHRLLAGGAGDGATAQGGEPAAHLGEGHLGHRRLHGGRGDGGRGQGDRERTPGGGDAVGVLAHDVERHHAGGGGQHDQDDTECQQLLAEGHQTGLGRTHERSTPVWGKDTQGRSSHQSHQSRKSF